MYPQIGEQKKRSNLRQQSFDKLLKKDVDLLHPLVKNLSAGKTSPNFSPVEGKEVSSNFELLSRKCWKQTKY